MELIPRLTEAGWFPHVQSLFSFTGHSFLDIGFVGLTDGHETVCVRADGNLLNELVWCSAAMKEGVSVMCVSP